MRDRVLADLPRSNNSCEGFHNALRSSITASHPNIWKLLLALKKEISLSELKLVQKERGERSDKRKKYALLIERIKCQVTTLDSRTMSCVEFIGKMSTNLG